jgi:hypothetical protein
MKKVFRILSFNLSMLLVLLFTAVYTFAQDAANTGASQSVSSSSSSSHSGTTWYATPWVWAIGAGVFILLLVAIARGRK